MKISGTSTLTADRTAVYRALNDPAVLVATIPGCQRLEALGDDAYKMTVAAGVGSIKGVYDGEVRLTDHDEPSRFTLKAQGAGAPGTIGAEVMVVLEDGDGGTTILSYDADAVVGGMIGGVGQRMLTGVSKKMADEFFRNVDAALSGAAPVGVPGAAGFPGVAGAPKPSGLASLGLPPGPSTVAPATPDHPAAAAAPGTVFEAPQARPSSGQQSGFVVGVAVGAAAALVGAIVGGWIASRRRG
jgi:carbon monoxide dehydrogenase subunit G